MNSKFVVILMLTMFVSVIFGQNLPFKYDSLVPMDNQEFIVYHKKQSGLYSVSQGKFTVPMSAAHLQYLENAKALYKIEKNTLSVFPFSDVVSFKPSEKIGTVYSSEIDEYAHKDGLIRINSSWIIVKQFKFPIQSDSPLVDMTGFDSTDVYGNFVYPAMSGGIEKSGLFDMHLKKWIISPIYGDIQQIGNYLLASNLLSEGFYENYEDAKCDIYEIDGKRVRFLRSEALKTGENWKIYLKNALQLDKIEQLNQDYDIYKIGKAGKETLIKFSADFELYFEYLMADRWFELVDINLGQQEILAYDQGKIFHYSLNYDSNLFEIKNTSEKYAAVSLFEGSPTFTNKSGYYRGDVQLSMEVADNQIIVVNYFAQISQGNPLINVYGDDSISTDGNYVYPPDDPGQYKSGVFDLTVKKWIVPQEYRFIIPVLDRYIAQSLNLDEFGLIQNAEIFQSVFDKAGKMILDPKTTKKLNRDEFVNMTLLGLDAQFAHIQRMPFQLMSSPFFEKVAQSYIYSVATNTKRQLVQFDFSLGNTLAQVKVIPDSQGEFIDSYFDLDSQLKHDVSYLVLLNNNDLTLSFAPNHEYITMQGNPKILVSSSEFVLDLYALNYSFYGSVEDLFYLVCVQYKDLKTKTNKNLYYALVLAGELAQLKSINSEEFNALRQNKELIKHTYTRANDQLIVQKTPSVIDSEPIFAHYSEEDGLSVNCSSVISGNSGVYKKNGTVWRRTTPIFAEMKSTKYGYLATEISFYQSVYAEYYFESISQKFIDSLNALAVNEQPGGQLLDKQFLPFKYKDRTRFEQIVEFEFGYQIFFSNRESIFISPSGQIICEEHFDFYELVDGKIKASSEALFDFDENGDFLYDANGKPVLLQVEKRKEFELKP